MHWDLASQRGAVAHAPHPLARAEPGGRGQSGGLQPPLQRVLLLNGEAELRGERRLGAAVQRGREPAADGRLQEEVPVGAEDAAGPPPGAAGPAAQQLPHEDPAAVRVREAPQGDGLGRVVPRRPAERHPAAAHILSAVPQMPALLPPELGLVSGEAALSPGGCRQADLETGEGNPHQRQKFGQIINAHRGKKGLFSE